MNARAFAEYLVSEGVIQTSKVRAVLEASAASGHRVDTAVLDLGLASEITLLDRLGHFSRSRVVSGAELLATPTEVASLLTPRVACRFGVVPFRRDGKTLHVAARDPGDLLIQDELGLMTGCMIVTYAVLEVRLAEALSRFYSADRSTAMAGLALRLSGKAPLPEAHPRAHHEPHAAPAASRPTPPSVAERHRERAVTRLSSQTPAELDLSPEELAMFPSLAGAEASPAADAGAGDAVPDVVPAAEPAPPAGEEPPGTEEPPTLEVLQVRAAEALQNAEMRDDIGDALLEFTRPFLSRRLLLTIRGDMIVGWRGEGPGVEPAAVRAIAIPRSEPSVFLGLLQGAAFWLGPLPPMVRNQDLRIALGEPSPQSCLVLPVKVRGKIVAFVYGDRGAEAFGALPMVDLKRLLAKTDIAFQVYLLKAKIRTL
jgi:hypothetical protein